MKNYTLPKFGSDAWLKALKLALANPNYKTMPSKTPLECSPRQYSAKAQENILIARTLIDGRINK